MAQGQGAGMNRESTVRWVKVLVGKGGQSRMFMHVAVHKDKSSCLSTGDTVARWFYYHPSRCASKLLYSLPKEFGHVIPIKLVGT